MLHVQVDDLFDEVVSAREGLRNMSLSVECHDFEVITLFNPWLEGALHGMPSCKGKLLQDSADSLQICWGAGEMPSVGQQGGVRPESQLHAEILPEVLRHLRPRRRPCAHPATPLSMHSMVLRLFQNLHIRFTA